MQRAVKFVTGCGKPWLLLVPNYIYTKQFYLSATRRIAGHPTRSEPPFYIAPTERYFYHAPRGPPGAGTRNAAGAVRQSGEAKTSPFLSFWYIGGLGAQTKATQAAWEAAGAIAAGGETLAARCQLARLPAQLPQHVMDSSDPNRRKLSREEKQAKRKKVSASGKPLCGQCGQIHGNCKHTR